MYSYSWDATTGGLLLNSSPLAFSKEPRPVYYKELDILGFDQYWKYDRNDSYPYLWAESNNYFYRGRLVAKAKGGSLYTAPEIIIVEEPEPNGAPLRFVDIPAMVEKNRNLLEQLVQDTIKRIYNTYVDYRDKVDVFYVAFSGGKDSIVAFDLVQRALPHNKMKVLFGDTGMEFPDTYKVVDQISEFCAKEGIDFLRSKCELEPEYTWSKFGPPAQTMRWCCSVHKTAPQIILLREYTENPHFRGMAFTGIRGDESASRSEYEDVSLGEKIRGQSFAKDLCVENYEKGVLTIRLLQKNTDWHEWIKTVGDVIFLESGDIEIGYEGKLYHVIIDERDEETLFTVNIGSNTKSDIYFMSAFKTALRKTAYCICCRVCEANCPNGFISMVDGAVKIDDRCVKCKKCHDVFHGCLVANSMRLPKGEKKMGSIDRYGNMGIEYSWVTEYFKKKDEFWDSPHSLGKNMVKYLKAFLNDSEITEKGKFGQFGETVDRIGIETSGAWGLMACNLAYTSEFNWWIKNIAFAYTYTPDEINSMLDDSMSQNSRSHIVSAFKNIFISNKILGNEIGMGKCEYEIKGGKRYWNNVVRASWDNPDPTVVLYGLYKFAEACDGYYQFTLSRLLDYDVESDGVSPAQIFGLDRKVMEQILTGLNINHPDYITAQFNLDLDTITLNSDKTSADVLALF